MANILYRFEHCITPQNGNIIKYSEFVKENLIVFPQALLIVIALKCPQRYFLHSLYPTMVFKMFGMIYFRSPLALAENMARLGVAIHTKNISAPQ